MCPTDQNPADIATRGPSFLQSQENNWPKETQLATNSYINLKIIGQEPTEAVVALTLTLNTGQDGFIVSIVSRIKRVFTRTLLGIIHYTPSRTTIHNTAILLILHTSQTRSLPSELEKNTLPSCTQDHLYLSKNDSTTRLIILDAYVTSHRSGTSNILNELRLSYLILSSRSAVLRVLSTCLACRKAKTKPFRLPDFTDLPQSRVSTEAPFSNVGIDHTGLFSVLTHNALVVKVWMILFTCFSTRTIHLELSISLSTEEFSRCLWRFIAKTGHPSIIYRDNGTNFKGATRVVTNWKESPI
uniref:Integrase_H2C2 domain-containing protein n=1 Tax=Heterorhabditis bacteriophora TaxID=37862 RepID=A0A1I7WCA9_HETBA